MKIGFFDSGIGGLNILRAVEEYLPQYEYLYFGDTKNVPYGDRSESEIYELTRQAMVWLFEHDALIIIIACNTASAETLRKLQDEFLPQAYPGRRILGVIIPTVEMLLEEGSHKVLLVGTQRTIASKKYSLELLKRNKVAAVAVESIATPTLVPFIEAGDIERASMELDSAIKNRVGEVDTLVLGCTHYTVLKNYVRESYPNLQRVISQDELIPIKLEQYLDRHPELKSQLGRGNTRSVHLT